MIFLNLFNLSPSLILGFYEHNLFFWAIQNRNYVVPDGTLSFEVAKLFKVTRDILEI